MKIEKIFSNMKYTKNFQNKATATPIRLDL